MKERQVQDRKKVKRISFPMFVVSIALVIAGIAAAGYMMSNRQSGIISARNFYFTSDLLKEESEGAVYYIDSHADSFAIKLYNYDDPKRRTQADIDYRITVDGGTTSHSSSGTLTAGESGEDSFTVKPTAKSITVTAEAASPYKKTLRAVFSMESGKRFTVDDAQGKTAAVLTMTCTDYSDSAKTADISLPSGVIPDETDSRISKSGSVYTYTFPKNGVYSLVLLKSDKTKMLKKDGGSFDDKITLEYQ